MNNKLIKILTGFSAFAVAGLLSLAPVTNAHAATANSAEYYIDVYEDELYITENNPSYSTSIDINDLHYSIYGATFDDLEANIYFYGADPDEDFTVSMALPYEVSQLIFTHYYGEIDYSTGEPNSSFVLGENGLFYNYSVSGNILTIYGNTASGANFDGVFIIVFAKENSPEDLFFEEINSVTSDILKAAQGIGHDGSENPDKVVEYKCNGAINYKVINALANTEGVTLLYTFEYQGYIFTSTITSADAAKMLIEGENWYGPCYIANNCGATMIGVVL